MGEVAIEDLFVDPYIGKMYGPSTHNPLPMETSTMAIERLAGLTGNPNVSYASSRGAPILMEDPDMIHWIVGMLAGV